MKLSVIRAPVLVGLLVVGVIFSFIWLASLMQTADFAGPDSYLVYAIFDDVTGLAEGSTVTMVGIPVGKIDSVERHDTEEGIRARVGIRLSKDVALYTGVVGPDGRLKGAASVERKQASILGDFLLAVSPGAFGDLLADEDQIPIVVGLSGLEAVLEQIGQASKLIPRLERILVNVEEISGGLAAAIGGEGGRQDLKEIVGNLKEISSETKELAAGTRNISSEIEALVQDGTFTRIAANVEEATVDAREIAQTLQQIVAAGDVQVLVANLSETAKQFNNMGIQLNNLVNKEISPRLVQLDRIFRNFERFSKSVATLTDESSSTISETLHNFKDFSAQAISLIQRGQGEVETALGSVKGTLLSAQLSLQKLDETIDNVRAISANLRDGKGTFGRLLTDDRLVEEVEEIVQDTKEFVKSYTLMQTEVEIGTAYNFLQGAFKTHLALRFRPKEDKYYLVQIIDDPRGNTTSQYVLTESSRDGVSKVLTETTDGDIKFSFQFAKRFYFLTGRVGIMESTGGLGLDFSFFKDRLQFQFDLFDFTLSDKPRLRGAIQWEIFRHFFLAGGADDVLNESYRDYFIQAGIRFTDEDLKSLLIASPSINL